MHNHNVRLLGGATTHAYGLTFESESDYALVENFVYADDSSFSILIWISKERCVSTTAEVLYSHSQQIGAYGTLLTNRTISNINMQLLCEQQGAGRPEFDLSTLSGSAIRCENATPYVAVFPNLPLRCETDCA